ncbi:MAG: hypothetical protein IIW46_06205, partial [Bacteroidaceae bacterium]|nr:hypothetical protein [Bacteroidaceae bacterium]
GNSTNFGLGFSAVRRLSPLCEQEYLRALKLQSQIIRTMIFWAALLGAIVTIILSPALSLWFFHDTSHALSICTLAPAVTSVH